MTGTNKFRIAVLIIAGILVSIAVWHGCTKKTDTTREAPAEQQRKRVMNTDSIAAAKYRQLAQKQAAQIEALQRDLTTAIGKDKAATTKAQQSATHYVKTPTLANCHQALKDCQEENGTKAYALQVQEQMISAQDSAIKVHVAEVGRQTSVIDTLAAGWQAANADNAVLEKKLKRRNKLLKIGGVVIAALVAGLAIK